MMYVIQTRPNQEDYLLWQLKYTGVNAYCPTERLTIRNKGKWYSQEKKIFSGYIFLEAEYSAELHQKIRRLDGYLHFLGNPSPLPDDEEQQIKWLCNDGKPITASHYINGKSGISFIDGILSRTKFEIIKMCPRQKRAKMAVSVNGRKFKVFLPIEKSEL